MTDVVTELHRLQRWEIDAKTSPLSPTALNAFEKVRQKSTEILNISARNAETREASERLLADITDNIALWLKDEFDSASLMMSTPPMKAQNLGRDVIRVNHTPTLSTRLESIFTQTLSFNAGSSEHAKTYHLHLCLCRMRHARVTSHMPRDSSSQLEALEDPALILLPTLGEATSPQNPRQSKASGFFVRVESVGRTVEVLMGPQPRFQPLPIKLAIR